MTKIVWVSSESRINDDTMASMIANASKNGWEYIFSDNHKVLEMTWEPGGEGEVFVRTVE